MEGEGKGGKGTLMYAALGLAVVALVLSIVALALPAPQQLPPENATTRTFRLSSDLLEGSNRYHPATLVAYAGDTLVFEVTNRGAAEHGFTVEGLGIVGVVQPGETETFTAEAVPAGLYEYFCHLHAGHVGGQLVVFDR